MCGPGRSCWFQPTQQQKFTLVWKHPESGRYFSISFLKSAFFMSHCDRLIFAALTHSSIPEQESRVTAFKHQLKISSLKRFMKFLAIIVLLPLSFLPLIFNTQTKVGLVKTGNKKILGKSWKLNDRFSGERCQSRLPGLGLQQPQTGKLCSA